jgi:hypothetical protein
MEKRKMRSPVTRSSTANGARRGLATWIATLALAMLLLPSSAFAQTAAAPKGNPPLASLIIEIWPEYDRPAALVILRGVLAENAKLPATITLRLPMDSGGPAALAYSTTADGNLLNLKHERGTAGQFITIKFETPERYFHVEFYEPIATSAPTRSFRYVWPGDFAVEHPALVVQVPAASTDMAVEPSIAEAAAGKDGLRYLAAELPALKAGQALPIVVRYTKADPRASADILKPKAADVAPAPAPVAAPAQPVTAGLPNWAFPVAGMVLFTLLGAALVAWWWRRESRPAGPAGIACAKCGTIQTAGNRFCSNCGAKIKAPER